VPRLSYVLPIRVSTPAGEEWTAYLRWLSARVELIVVDGSPPPVFAQHAQRLEGVAVCHVAPDADLRGLINGKVAGVLSGLRRASQPSVIVADDDVRYDDGALAAMARALEKADVVRPQNYFRPLPWHAVLDTARTLLNRVSGGDWPGTLGVRRCRLAAAGGYDGDVLFENLELVRTVIAAGGISACPLDLYVRRVPPSASHFWSQRVRQAYDEFARPWRLAIWMSVVPAAAALIAASRWRLLGGAVAGSIVLAEIGRRRAGGAAVFPVSASFSAPLWLAERGVCSWLAISAYLRCGGVPYGYRIVSRAATPLRQLRARFGGDVRAHQFRAGYPELSEYVASGFSRTSATSA